MLRDASHKQVIDKFSFIESLDLSRGLDKESSVNSKSEDSSQSPESATASSSKTKPSSIIPVMASATTIDTKWYQPSEDNYGLSLAEIFKHSAPDNSFSVEPKSRNYIGKILFSLATGYCLFVLWWLFGHQGNRLVTALTGGKQVSLSKSDVEFIDYAERALENIEREFVEDTAEEDKVVYVPVYTPSTAPATREPEVANLPSTTTAFPSNSPAPSPPPSEALKIPAPPPLPASTPIEAPAEVAVAKPEPQVKSTLIGILELGDNKSAALVKAQGQTKRIWLGERINNEGWILESVSNQTANIINQGETRSISVGEIF